MLYLSSFRHLPSESICLIRFCKTNCNKLAKRWLCLSLVLLLSYAGYAQVPVASFTSNKQSGCGPLVVNFTDQSTNSPATWNWDFGNGTLSSVQNPTIVYSAPGTYTVTLVVTNANGTHGVTKTNYITVDPSPTTSFSADKLLGCAPSTIRFTDLTNPNGVPIVSWNWDFGDGTTSTAQNPTKTYSTPGFYTITLRVVSSSGCQGAAVRANYIRIVNGVTAEFSNTEPATCRQPFIVDFTNLTSAPGNVTFQWDFGNGTSSTVGHPTATYAAAGTYNVRLTVQSDLGCSGFIEKPVTINSPVTSIGVPDTVCLNSPITFQNTSTPTPVSSQWFFDNGRQSSLVSDTSSYSTSRNYTIKLINTYGNCTDSAFKTIHVKNNPVVDFTAPSVTSCKAPVTINFQDLSTGAVGWQWNFGDGGTSTLQNPPWTYNAEGQFDVSLTITDNKGCQNTVTKTAFVKIIKPVLHISNIPNGGCIPYAFTPVAVVDAIDGVASWFWDFGDAGATSTLQNPPPHTYADSGTYTLKLKITTNGGCADSIVAVNTIKTGPLPHPGFTYQPTADTCANAMFRFTDQSWPADRWVWQFGDGTTSVEQNPEHQFTDTGYFSVTLTVYNNGCPLSFTHPTPVHIKPPAPELDYLVNCTNRLQVTFVNQSKTDLAYGPISYSWSFGDPANTTSTQFEPTFTYPALGDYIVNLTVTNGACTVTHTEEINLVGEPADFTVPPSVCKGANFNITAINSDPQNVSDYSWSINGGTFTSGPRTLTTSLPDTGVYSIGLTVTDINGCSITNIVSNAVRVTGPVAGFFPVTRGGCINSTITFTDTSSPAGTINRWMWDFGDGHVQQYNSNVPFTHQYTDTGRFVVRLSVRDNAGCDNTVRSPDTIVITKPVAMVSANYITICPLTNAQFKDSSSGKDLTYLWNFGDGNTGTDQHPVHIYTGADSTYDVKLIITDSIGCKDSVTVADYVTVRAPKPAFDMKDTSTICPPIETKFTFRGGDYESFYWDFGDGATSTLLNPTHFYNTYGTYEARLVLIGYGGCSDTARDTVRVLNPYTVTALNYSPIINCNELLVDFNITIPAGTKFTFLFGDGKIDSSQATTFQHFYDQPAYYRPALILKDSMQCQVGIGSRDTIKVIGAIPLFGVSGKTFCDTGTVFFTNYTLGNSPVTSRTWSFGPGEGTSSDVHPVHTFTRPGTYVVSQFVTTQAGCSKTIYDTIRIYGTPYSRITGDSVVCINELLPLQGSLIVPDTSITWLWNLGNGAGANTPDASTRYGATGDYNVSLVTTNLLGCKDTTLKRVYVPPTPTITFTNDPILPIGTGATLPASYSENISRYTWTPNYNLSCTDCPNPFASPKLTTKYKVEVEDIYGCTGSNEVTVTVVCNAQNYFMPNTFSPNGDGVNDVFAPRGTGLARISTLKIFNRWGELVFERRNFMANDRSPTGGWDGTFKGRPASPDVYVYIVEFICENAAIIPVKGNVTLVR